MIRATIQGVDAAMTIVVLPLGVLFVAFAMVGLFWVGALVYFGGLAVALVWSFGALNAGVFRNW